jgi:hypothetical protein
MDLTSTFAPIAKTVEQDDGTLLVYGKATDGGLDLDDQRCDPTWLSTAMPEWFSTAGNIRAQHRADSAVGKAIEHTFDPDGHYITARIVDREAIAKTKAGVFTGFSIGIRRPKIVKSPIAPNGLINGGQITEVSLCDRPANPACTLMLCKAAASGWEGRASDFDQERGLVKCEDLNFYPENNVVLKTVAEPIKFTGDDTRLIDALKQTRDAIGAAFTPAEQKAPGQPEFKEPVEKAGKACCGDCKGKGDNCSCGCDDCPGDTAKSPAVHSIKTMVTIDPDVVDAKIQEALKASNQALIDSIVKQRGDDTVPFDREAAIALVNKATDGLGQDESGDIAGANAAIGQIAQLIISEAKDLAKMPAQGCDIHLLMSAVDALRCFARREQMEQNAVDPDIMMLAADADEAKSAKYSADELKAMLKAGKAMKNPNGDPSYPIGDKADLSNAIHAVGRGSGDHDAIRSYIKRRASALGASDMIPDSWKMADATTTKADNVSDTLTTDSAEAAPENVEAVAEKAADDATTEEVVEDAEKTADADTETSTEELTKAVGAEVDTDSLVKAFKGVFEDTESELRKMFVDIVEAKTEGTVKALKDELGATKALNDELSARLTAVEQMATPGGPNLRRTEMEQVNARRGDLTREIAHYKALAAASEDPDHRKGFMQKALQLTAQVKAL